MYSVNALATPVSLKLNCILYPYTKIAIGYAIFIDAIMRDN